MGRANKGASAVADLQMPGSDVELTVGDVRIKLPDPLEVAKQLCEVAADVDSATDPWPREEGEPVEYVRTHLAEKIGNELIRKIARLGHLRIFVIHYLFRNKESWESAGRSVLGQMKRPSGLLKEYASTDFIVLLNWQAWQNMTPMQRVALVYHELRHGNVEGKLEGHDFEGFFDELALFGTDTYRDWNLLAKAVDKGEEVRHQFSLDFSKLDQPAEASDERGTAH